VVGNWGQHFHKPHNSNHERKNAQREDKALNLYTRRLEEEGCSRDVSIRDTVLKPCYSDGVARLLHQAPEAQPLYVAHPHKDALGRMCSIS
jgi:hypothetical protein